MRKVLFLVILLGFSISACLPAILQPQATAPSPITVEDLQKTATMLSQQTVESSPATALSTETIAPSNTPKVMTATFTPTVTTPTETQNSVLLTLTATLGTGTPGIQTTGLSAGAVPSNTPNPAFTNTAIGIAHPQHYGTMPPNLPFGQVSLINRSKVEVYISLQCTTKEGYATVIEYPVRTTVKTDAPAGNYTYVVWVGGRQIVGNFKLDKSQELKITIYKDRVQIK